LKYENYFIALHPFQNIRISSIGPNLYHLECIWTVMWPNLLKMLGI
jgi:hypothetical protein